MIFFIVFLKDLILFLSNDFSWSFSFFFIEPNLINDLLKLIFHFVFIFKIRLLLSLIQYQEIQKKNYRERLCIVILIVHILIIDLHLIYVAMKWLAFNWIFGIEIVNSSKYQNNLYISLVCFFFPSSLSFLFVSIYIPMLFYCIHFNAYEILIESFLLSIQKKNCICPHRHGFYCMSESQWRHNYFLIILYRNNIRRKREQTPNMPIK